MASNDLTTVDLKDYGIKGELPKLLATVEKRRARERGAAEALNAARDAKATVRQRMTDAAAQAARDDADEPDLAAMLADTEQAVEIAQARLKGATQAREEAERAVVVYVRNRGDADRGKAEAAVADRAAAAGETLEAALGQVDALLEAVGVRDALTPPSVPGTGTVPAVTPAGRSKLHRALADVLGEVRSLAPVRLAAVDERASA